MAAHRSLSAQVRREKACPSCGAALKSHRERTEGVCQRPQCMGPHLAKKKAEEQRKVRIARERAREQAKAYLEQVQPQGFEVLSNHLLLVVPSADREVETVSEERREALKQHLQQIFQIAAEKYQDEEQRERHRKNYAEYVTKTRETLGGQIVDNGCATCRGYCCKAGEDHGLLDADFILSRMILEPELSPEELMQQYVDHVPETSMAGSCIFHSPTGCTMDRSIRAPICNRFLCDSFTDDRELLEQDPNHPSLAIAMKDGDVLFRRLGVMDRDGSRSETDLKEPPIDQVGAEQA